MFCLDLSWTVRGRLSYLLFLWYWYLVLGTRVVGRWWLEGLNGLMDLVQCQPLL